MSLPAGLSLTWFGHSTFLIRLPNGKRLLIDPFLKGNPVCPPERKEIAALGPVDLLLVTHGHSDHFADAIEVAKTFGCPVAANYEILSYMGTQGVENIEPMNKGGSVTRADLGLTITLTHAFHSSTITTDSGTINAGEPCGFVVSTEDDSGRPFAFYFAGDTAVFSDMALISELYSPSLAFLPIGDRFTMGPREAAKAVTLMSSVDSVVPMHYGTFGLLTGTPEAFRQALADAESGVRVLVFEPGETQEF
ncbi:MAG: metal-dependent hydrolase [Capsulimonadales bacterium]|nr:metal-dependent hydrolase [Capsulimonadales bacterium]